jgi:CRISPR-associated protein Cmr3
MTAYRFLDPLDVLFLRGNRLFGDPGSFGEALVPPWPSAAAGAIRSQMLASEGVDLAAFAAGRIDHPQLGTPARPGSFAVRDFLLARRSGERIVTLYPLPADLIAARDGAGLQLHRLQPAVPAASVETSAPLPRVPVLAADSRAKPEPGIWLTQAGWQQYLDGELPAAEELVEAKTLWKLDPRVGVGLDAERRRAGDGKLFTVQAVVLAPDHGFLAAVDGADPPANGTLRLGGDGRAAAVHAVAHRPPEPDYAAIAAARRCRLVLTSPGIFPHGWRPPGLDVEDRLSLAGLTARLVGAAVPRAEVISGWDLAGGQPKPAQRAAPAGSVYWLEDLRATADELRNLAAAGLWPEVGCDAERRAEGFNRCALGAWG